MARKATKKVEKQEVSRVELENGTIIIKFDDGSIQIIPAAINLTKEEAEKVFGSDSDSDEDEDEDEDDSDEDEDDEGDDEDEDDDDSDDEDEDEDEDDEEEEEEEIDGETLAGMDFEELEDLCDDQELETDPDDYDEKDIEKLRKSIAKELGIELPKKEKGKKKK